MLRGGPSQRYRNKASLGRRLPHSWGGGGPLTRSRSSLGLTPELGRGAGLSPGTGVPWDSLQEAHPDRNKSESPLRLKGHLLLLSFIFLEGGGGLYKGLEADN